MTALRDEQIEFNRFFKESNDLYHDLALKIGLSDSAFEILYTIAVLGDGCLQRDICSAAYLSKQTVNSSIGRLKQDGFLYFEAGKRRDLHIHLTEYGLNFVQQKIEPVIEMENRAFEGLSDPERRQLLILSRRYIEFLRREVDVLLHNTF